MNDGVLALFAGLALTLPAGAVAAPAAPPPAASLSAPSGPRVATPPTAARTALARELVGHTQPKELMLSAVLSGWDRAAAEGKDDVADLDELQPGLGARFAERAKAELVGMVAQRIPQMHERLATLFAAHCTEEELKGMIAFYSSPAGAKLIRSITMSDEGGESFDDEKVTAEEATRANRAAALEAAKSLNGDERLTMMKFAVSPAGRAAKALGPQVQAISAEWMTQLMAEFGKRIEPIAEEMVKQAIAEADKGAGTN